jgi:Cu/Ag efflux pump CusA
VRSLVAAALRLRWVVTVLSFLMLVVGFRLIQTTPLDVFPEFSPLLVEIQTEAPGLSTSEVESLVSTPVENAVNGVKGLKTLRSKSVIAGLAIALGEVVDDAIIDVENVFRRLRLNHASAQPQPAWQIVLEASLEVRSAVVYATLIVILVFLPVFFLEGLAGSFFRPLALAYVLSVTASLAVALTVTPALALILLPRTADAPQTHVTGWFLCKPAVARRLGGVQ